jgi:hypothetical protein
MSDPEPDGGPVGRPERYENLRFGARSQTLLFMISTRSIDAQHVSTPA